MAESILTASSVVLFDTNVWMDYFTDRYRTARLVGSIIDAIDRRGATLVTSIMSVHDSFFIMRQYLARFSPQGAGGAGVAAWRQIAWSCAKEMRQRSTIVGADVSDLVEAECLRAAHDDLEDNLILAAAKRSGATIFVTGDARLRSHAPVSSYSVEELASMIEMGA